MLEKKLTEATRSSRILEEGRYKSNNLVQFERKNFFFYKMLMTPLFDHDQDHEIFLFTIVLPDILKITLYKIKFNRFGTYLLHTHQ